MNPKDVLGDIHISDAPTSELPIKDSLDLARHVWKKGRHGSMGGPTVYTQGHGAPGYENQGRSISYTPAGYRRDPIADDLGLDIQE